MTPTLSIIIPTLNEANNIGPTLDSVSKLTARVEVLLVDGGSKDHTTDVASAHGARIITSEPGRGSQMHRGACAAQADVFWFLHADTVVPADAVDLIVAALRDQHVVAGNFEVCFDGAGVPAGFMTWLYPQLRRLGLWYGDSAIFVRRSAYFRAGGFKAFPIFEDLDLLRELKKMGKFDHLSATVVTSSRRFEGRSFVFTFTRWVALQFLFWLGVNPERLGRLYVSRGASKKLNLEKAGRSKSLSSIYDDGKT
jgi:rSAM/selenodomain-associated transferase 2